MRIIYSALPSSGYVWVFIRKRTFSIIECASIIYINCNVFKCHCTNMSTHQVSDTSRTSSLYDILVTCITALLDRLARRLRLANINLRANLASKAVVYVTNSSYNNMYMFLLICRRTIASRNGVNTQC